MPKIITISIGSCGNHIAAEYWKQLCEEAEIDLLGQAKDSNLKYLQYYFQERNTHYIPNTIYIDSDPEYIDEIQTNEMKNLFDNSSFVSELFPSQGIFQNPNDKKSGSKLEELIDKAVKKQTEEADTIQGIQVIVGSAGGAGSGISAFLSDYLRTEYPAQYVFSNIVFPTVLNCQSPLELYNTVLLFNHLKGQITFSFDNEAVQRTCFDTFLNQTPDFASVNQLIASGILGTTQSLRYPGKVNTSFLKMAQSLLPLYQLHFVTINKAPLLNKCQNLMELCSELFTENQQFFSYKPSEGKYLTCELLLKGNISLPELDQAIYSTQPRQSFINWIPDNIQKTFCSEYGELEAQLISNSTAVRVPFGKILDETKKLFENNGYLHVYNNIGIEKMDIQLGLEKINDIYNDYQQYGETSDQIIQENDD